MLYEFFSHIYIYIYIYAFNCCKTCFEQIRSCELWNYRKGILIWNSTHIINWKINIILHLKKVKLTKLNNDMFLFVNTCITIRVTCTIQTDEDSKHLWVLEKASGRIVPMDSVSKEHRSLVLVWHHSDSLFRC